MAAVARISFGAIARYWQAPVAMIGCLAARAMMCCLRCTHEIGDVLDLHAAALAVGPGLAHIDASLGSYNGMAVTLYEFDFDGNGSVDLAFYSRNVIGFTDLLAGFG